MGPRLIGGLALVTLMVTLAATVIAIRQPDSSPVGSLDAPAFPALRERPDAVARAVIGSAEGEITLVREAPERWVAQERAGYPVLGDKVRALVVALADMRLIEAKTRRPDRYERLELEDPDAEGATSRLVRIEDENGGLLAEAIFGKQRQRLTGTEPSGIYLRRPGEEQTWLASGSPQIDVAVQDWLQTTIVDLAPGKVQDIEMQPADGEPFAFARQGDGGPLALQDLGEDEQLDPRANLDQLAGSFGGLALEDVRPASEVAWPESPSRVRVRTADGLELSVRLALIDDQPWLAIESVRASGPAAEEEADPPARPNPEEIAARTDGWAYRIGRPIFDRLTRPRSAWLKASDGTS